MSAESAISWLARRAPDGTWHQGHTLNPWSGCYVKSDGCRECYAKNLPPAMRRGAVWGPREMRVLAPDSYLAQAHAWNRAAEKLGIRMPVFCASVADIFERHVVESERERLNGQRAKVWALVAATPWLDWLFLTKEPENILGMIPAEWAVNGCPVNAWMGATMENQETAAKRWGHLERVPAAVLFASIEPMVGPIDLAALRSRDGSRVLNALTGYGRWADVEEWQGRSLGWVLCGGESGRGVNVRPMHPQWARSLRDQCVAANVAFHFKQHGEWVALPSGYAGPEEGRWVYNTQRDAVFMHRLGKKATGRILDGRTWDQLPEVTRG